MVDASKHTWLPGTRRSRPTNPSSLSPDGQAPDRRAPDRRSLDRRCGGRRAACLLGLALGLGLLPPPVGVVAQQPGGQPGAGQPGQDPQGQGPLMREEGDYIAFSFNETQGMELAEFIKWTERTTGKVFIFNETDLQTAGAGAASRVTFVGTLRLKKDRFRDDFFAFFQTMLYIKGFAVVPRGEGDLEMLEIVSMNGPRGREVTNGARYVKPEDLKAYASQTGVPILTTMPLKFINATVATNSLRPFFGTGAGPAGGTLGLGNVGNNTAILLQGFGPQVYAAVQILELVDQPLSLPELLIRVVLLEHAAAEEIEPLLNDILNDRNRTRSQAAGAQGGQGVTGAPIEGLGGGQIKVAVHQSLKAIILSGTAEQITEAQELIARLDVPALPLDGTASVVRLKNVLAEDLRQTLNQFVTEDSAAERQAATGAPGGGAAPRQPRRTVIQAHKESNSLLISASATKYNQILHLVDELDRRQPQVLIEAALVELTTGDLKRFGVELGLIDIKDNGDFTRPFGYTHFGQSVFQDTDDDGLPDTRLPDFDNPLQGLTGGIISSSDFAIPVLLNALASDSRANILSLPSVLVNNNEAAVVKTEEERPTTQVNSNASTSTQGVGQPRQAGITLEISPTISPNNYLRLNVNLVVSRFVGAFDPNSATGGGVVLKREIRTQVTMPSDDTMVLGGVIEDQESRTETGIPFLKDIPLLGYLFRTSNDENQKTNLYFFVTPTILDEDDFQDLYQVSLTRKMQAEQYIGTRRLQIVDRRWTGGAAPSQARLLEDRGATLEDLDAQGSHETPYYQRPGREHGIVGRPGAPTGPTAPGQGK